MDSTLKNSFKLDIDFLPDWIRPELLDNVRFNSSVQCWNSGIVTNASSRLGK